MGLSDPHKTSKSPVYIGFQIVMQRIIPNPLIVYRHDSTMSWDSIPSAVEAGVPQLVASSPTVKAFESLVSSHCVRGLVLH